MIKSRWVLPAVAIIVVTAAGCGGQPTGDPDPGTPPAPAQAPAAPVSGPVTDIQAICGIQGVYWQGTWWADMLPIQSVRNETSTRFISGTMTTVGNHLARLDSPDLMAPQILYMTPNQNPNAPPYVTCAPVAP